MSHSRKSKKGSYSGGAKRRSHKSKNADVPKKHKSRKSRKSKKSRKSHKNRK